MGVYKSILKFARIANKKERKDVRLYFKAGQSVVADCQTDNCEFEGVIQNVSSSGVFINTVKPMSIGQEIALSFKFPGSGNKVMATGEIVRATYSGIGVEIKIIFKGKN